MQMRRLGRTGVQVTAIGCGGIPIFRAEKPEAVKVLRYAIDKGINYFDTARGYDNGGSEERLAEAIRGQRSCSKRRVAPSRASGQAQASDTARLTRVCSPSAAWFSSSSVWQLRPKLSVNAAPQSTPSQREWPSSISGAVKSDQVASG